MKEFITEAVKPVKKGQEVEEDSITFLHDGREVTFYLPQPGQFAIMMQLSATVTRQQDKTKVDPNVLLTFIEFFFEMMDDDTQVYFRHRLMDRKDPFEIDGPTGVGAIFKYLTEEWSGRPTVKPSGSRPARRATGNGSTGSTRAKASTSSNSRSRASSR